MESALDELRTLAQGIYPPLLSSGGLAEALAAACRRTPIRVRLDADGVGRYQPELEAAVYYCCLEALQNAAKHGGGSVAVRVWEEDGEIAFEVRDDGPGLDPERAGTGAGLTNMRDRVGALGGRLELASNGTGTAVRGAVPAQPSAR